MTTIHHVNVAVDDLAAATVFYRDVIGLDPAATPDLGFPAQFFSVGSGQELHVNELDDLHPNGTHFCLRLDDFASVVGRAEAAGVIDVDSWGRASRIGTGVIQLFVRDPAGNLIELNSQPDERFADAFYDRPHMDPGCSR
jgi:catechol 2,3-dioxygenase-like lactoylglutathione lyase family enzyme